MNNWFLLQISVKVTVKSITIWLLFFLKQNYGSGAVCFVRNDDVPAKASESQSDMDTVVLLGTLNMSW